MSAERPRRNAKKLPDPDFYTELPLLSPSRGQKRRFSFDGNLEVLETILQADITSKKSPKKCPATLSLKIPPKSPKSARRSPQKSVESNLHDENHKAAHDNQQDTTTPTTATTTTTTTTTPPCAGSNKSTPVTPKKSPPLPQTVKTPSKSPPVRAARSPQKAGKLALNGPCKVKSPFKKGYSKKLSPSKKVEIVKKPKFRDGQQCKVTTCTNKAISCLIEEPGCPKTGKSTRWYHISSAEHYCNSCFEYFYRSHMKGHAEYLVWRRRWSANSQAEPRSKLFVVEHYLPYWLRCTTCGKWRQLPRTTHVTPALTRRYVCGTQPPTATGELLESDIKCCDPEDERVAAAQDSSWVTSLQVTPYLESSPAAPFLKHYYPDGVGMSPSAHTFVKTRRDSLQLATGAHSVQGSDSDCSISISSDDSSATPGKEELSSVKSESVAPVKQESPQSLKSELQDVEQQGNDTRVGFLQPFHQPEEALRAQCLPPDVMLDFELEHFPEYANFQQMYLGLRNIVLTLWCLNCKEWLTPEKCYPHVICRGLGRVRAVQEIDRIVLFLTRHGHINAGMLRPPAAMCVPPEGVPKENVIIVGAGPSGLAAARQLERFGVPVTVLEARDRIGGRVWDDDEMSIRVGHGAMIIVGHINNPITLLCEQLGLRTRTIHDHCDLFMEDGTLTDADMDSHIEVHFNALLDSVAEWRRNRKSEEDDNLLSRIEAMHQRFLENSEATFSQKEWLLLQFHISNLEYACGCELSKASALHWDQNEFYPQFTGYHSMIADGYSAVLARLAEGLDVRLETEVSKIQYNTEGVTIETKKGEVIKGSKVIVTLPLAILQRGLVEFDPPLPKEKVEAIHSLGAGIIEKVALEFPFRFWDEKLKGADFFGLVPSSEEKRGLFGVFYDITPREERQEDSGHVLMTWVSGSAIRLIQDKTDDEVVEMCMDALRNLFSDKEVCDPVRSFVTRWGRDPHSLMSYSYVPVGSSGLAYEGMAKDVDSTLFFAGEATNRQFPQTVTGAYLSGLREANKVLSTCFTPFERHALITVKQDIPGKRGRKANLLKVVKLSSPDSKPSEAGEKAASPAKLNATVTRTAVATAAEAAAEKPEKETGCKAGKRTSTAWVRAPAPAKASAKAKDVKNGKTDAGVVLPRKRGRPPKVKPSPEKLNGAMEPTPSPVKKLKLPSPAETKPKTPPPAATRRSLRRSLSSQPDTPKSTTSTISPPAVSENLSVSKQKATSPVTPPGGVSRKRGRPRKVREVPAPEVTVGEPGVPVTPGKRGTKDPVVKSPERQRRRSLEPAVATRKSAQTLSPATPSGEGDSKNTDPSARAVLVSLLDAGSPASGHVQDTVCLSDAETAAEKENLELPVQVRPVGETEKPQLNGGTELAVTDAQDDAKTSPEGGSAGLARRSEGRGVKQQLASLSPRSPKKSVGSPTMGSNSELSDHDYL